MQALGPIIDPLILKCLPDRRDDSVEIGTYLRSTDDPVGSAGAFYTALNTEISFEFGIRGNGNNLDVFEAFLDRGVNMVDAMLQTLKLPALGDMLVFEIVPHLNKNSVVALGSSEDNERFMASVARLDQIFAKALALDAFPPDLDSRRGLPRVYSGQHLGIPLNDPKARLFALVLCTSDPLDYIAHSPLMQDCMKSWFDEISQLDSGYPSIAINRMLTAFSKINTDIFRRAIFVESDNRASLGVMGLHKLVAQNIANLDLDDGVPPYASEAEKAGIPFQWVERFKDHLVEVTSNLITSGSFVESRRALQPFFTDPESFVRLLVSNDVANDRAFSLFAHALGDYLKNGRGDIAITHDCADLQEKIDLYREVFQAAGYPDIKGTHALDTLCLDIEHGEYFHARGYLRVEEMGLEGEFCKRGYTSLFRVSHAESVTRRERKVEFAIAMGQIQMLIPCAISFLNSASVSSHDKDFEIPSLIEKLLTRTAVTPGQIIKSREGFKLATSCGLKAGDLLADPAVADMMGEHVASVLEDDLGL